MSSNYSNGNKTIKDITEYDSFIKSYKDKKYDDITPNFKDNNIKIDDINLKLIYKLEDVKNLIFLSNDKEVVIVLLNKDVNNLYHLIISKNVVTESKNIVKLGDIITFEWNTKSKDDKKSKDDNIFYKNIKLFVILGILAFLIVLFFIYYKYKKNNNGRKL